MTTYQAKLEADRLRGRKLIVSTIMRILVAWLVLYPLNLLVLCWLGLGSLADAVLGFCTPLIRFLPPFSAPDSPGSWFVTDSGQKVPVHSYGSWEGAFFSLFVLFPIALICFLPLPMVATFRAVRRFLYLTLGPERFGSIGLIVAAIYFVLAIYVLFLSEHPRLMYIPLFLFTYPCLAFFDSDDLRLLKYDDDVWMY